MKKDYNNISFKNSAIDRMTSRTTSPPKKFGKIWSHSTNKGPMWNNDETGENADSSIKRENGVYDNMTHYMLYNKATKADTKTKEPLAYDIRSKLPKETVAAPTKKKSTGLEYEPKVRKRHMKP